MTCQDVKLWCGAWFDRELTLERSTEMEAHLATCPECQKHFQMQESFLKLSQEKIPRHEASPILKNRILAHLREEAAERTPWWQSLLFLRMAGMILTIIVVSLISVQGWKDFGARHDLTEQTIADHVRSLQNDNLLAVVSTDQHTVKPWFNGKINFAPTVIDYAAQGFPLIGGRLDVLDHQTVATLIYQRRKHIITVFTWPVTDRAIPQFATSERGYQIHAWVQQGMDYVVISDLSEGELTTFVDMIQRH